MQVKKKLEKLNNRLLEGKSILYSEYLTPYQTPEQYIENADRPRKDNVWKTHNIREYIPTRVYQPLDTNYKNNKLIIFLHGGPDLSIKDPEESSFIDFFKILVGQGFTIVAPEIRGASENAAGYAKSEYDGRMYKKDIVDVIEQFKQEFYPKETLGIFHSWAGHQGSNALLSQENLLDRVILIAGTSYPAARDFSFDFDYISRTIQSFGLDKDDADPASLYYKTESRYEEAYNNRYGVKCFLENDTQPESLIANSIIIDKCFARKISYGLNLDQTPKIPYMVIHSIDDQNVPFSLSATLVDNLIEQNRQVFGLFSKNGKHSWFKNDDNGHKDTFDYMYPKLLSFLNGELDHLNMIELDGAKYENANKILLDRNIINWPEKLNKFLEAENVGDNLSEGIQSYIKNHTEIFRTFMNKLKSDPSFLLDRDDYNDDDEYQKDVKNIENKFNVIINSLDQLEKQYVSNKKLYIPAENQNKRVRIGLGI